MIPIETTRSTTEQLFGVTLLPSLPASPTNTSTNEIAAGDSSTPIPWLFLVCVALTLAGVFVLYRLSQNKTPAYEGRITGPITKIPIAENTKGLKASSSNQLRANASRELSETVKAPFFSKDRSIYW
jgi:hypothetical protein